MNKYKIIVELNDINMIDDYVNVDGLIVNSIYGVSTNPAYFNSDKDKVINFCEKNNINLIIRVDKIISETELKEVKEFIFDNKQFSFIYTDFAIYTLFKQESWDLNKLYYFAQTYLVNKEDINYYASIGIKVLISNELSLDEINTIINNVTNNVGILAYGYFQIYYTKRLVISLFNDYCNNELSVSKNKIYDLKEEIREDEYKVYESNDYSIILSSKKMFINHLDEGIDLNKFDFIYLSNWSLDRNSIINMLKYYNCYRNHNIDKEAFENISEDTFKSFLYKTNEIL